MTSNESYMTRILALRKELCRLAGCLLQCDPRDQEFYDKVAQYYATWLKSLEADCMTRYSKSVDCGLTGVEDESFYCKNDHEQMKVCGK